jgi:hypothetical protein
MSSPAWRRRVASIRLLLAAAAWGPGCFSLQPPDGDVVPPAVAFVTPVGEAVEVGVRIEVEFTEAVDASVVTERLVVLVPEARVDEAFLTDLDKPPLSASRQADLEAGALEQRPGGSRVVFTPDRNLRGGTPYAVVVSAAVVDRAGNPLVDGIRFDERGRVVSAQNHVVRTFTTRDDPPGTGAAGCRLAISEILANPLGEESQGEFLEVINLGPDPLDLTGFTLDDSGGTGAGDLLDACPGYAAVLPPSGVALLVGLSFLPAPDLAPGTVLVCGPRTTLTPRGLKNSGGESLVLRDATGLEADRYGGWLDFGAHEGCSAQRIDVNAPDAAENWRIPDGGAEGEPCTNPGWIAGGS